MAEWSTGVNAPGASGIATLKLDTADFQTVTTGEDNHFGPFREGMILIVKNNTGLTRSYGIMQRVNYQGRGTNQPVGINGENSNIQDGETILHGPFTAEGWAFASGTQNSITLTNLDAGDDIEVATIYP